MLMILVSHDSVLLNNKLKAMGDRVRYQNPHITERVVSGEHVRGAGPGSVKWLGFDIHRAEGRILSSLGENILTSLSNESCSGGFLRSFATAVCFLLINSKSIVAIQPRLMQGVCVRLRGDC